MAQEGTNIRRLLCAFFALAIAVSHSSDLCARDLKRTETPALASFDSIEREWKRFQTDLDARKYRHRYEDLIRQFESFGKKFPQHAKADRALTRAAQLREDIAQITRSNDDFKIAERAYLVIVEKYPNGSAADEALYKAARIRFGELKDKAGATQLLKQFLPAKAAEAARYKGAQNLLAQLVAPPKASPSHDKKVAVQHGDANVINNIAIENHGNQLRMIVRAGSKLNVKQGEVKKSENPRRIYFDLSPALLDESIPSEMNSNQPGVFKIRVGQYQDDVVRIVAEVDDSVKATLSSQNNAIWVDISTGPVQVKSDDVLVEVQSPPELIKKEAGLRPKKIVLDPGHGGDDPGAIGRGGLREKNVTLAIAKNVKRLIERDMPDIKVYLTRTDDRTMPLSKRTELANGLEADLFISIHANAAQNPYAQGIETYYLNIAHDRYAIRLAARENAMSETEISNLEFILADLAMKSNVSDSMRLGQVVQSSTFSHVQRKWRDAKDLGLKHALFYVLLGARMPAILIETSFISNREEEKRLKSESYQYALAEGVVRGIKRYVEEKQAMYTP